METETENGTEKSTTDPLNISSEDPTQISNRGTCSARPIKAEKSKDVDNCFVVSGIVGSSVNNKKTNKKSSTKSEISRKLKKKSKDRTSLAVSCHFFIVFNIDWMTQSD